MSMLEAFDKQEGRVGQNKEPCSFLLKLVCPISSPQFSNSSISYPDIFGSHIIALRDSNCQQRYPSVTSTRSLEPSPLQTVKTRSPDSRTEPSLLRHYSPFKLLQDSRFVDIHRAPYQIPSPFYPPKSEAPMDNERTGTSGGDEPVACEIDRTNEPYEGMEFESDEAAKVFYEEYARRVGFLTRILNSRKSERDGSLISRHLGCRGIVDSKKADAQNQKRDRPKEPCPATIMVKRDDQGKWVIRKFVREHNHALEDPSQNKRPALDDKDRKIQDLINELRIKKRLSATYRDQLFELMKDVEEHNDNLAVKVQGVRDKLRALESRKQVPPRPR